MEETEQNPPRKSGSFLWLYGVVLVLALVVLGIGIYLVANGRGGYSMLAAGMVSVIAVLLVWAFNFNLTAARESLAFIGGTPRSASMVRTTLMVV